MLLRNRNYNLFDEMFRDSFFSHPFETSTSALMKTDVQEKDDMYLVDMELPGFLKEDIQAELKDGYMTISATRNEHKEEKDNDGKYICRERFVGTCKRSFYVGDQMKQEDIQASFENGVLRLRIPKNVMQTIEDQPKLIEIQ
ncbi:MAG: Hsp20/alpha crystallin family protein [Lachnospiraceae bacterium]